MRMRSPNSHLSDPLVVSIAQTRATAALLLVCCTQVTSPQKGKAITCVCTAAERRHEKPNSVGNKVLEQMDLQHQYISQHAVQILQNLAETVCSVNAFQRRSRAWYKGDTGIWAAQSTFHPSSWAGSWWVPAFISILSIQCRVFSFSGFLLFIYCLVSFLGIHSTTRFNQANIWWYVLFPRGRKCWLNTNHSFIILPSRKSLKSDPGITLGGSTPHSSWTARSHLMMQDLMWCFLPVLEEKHRCNIRQ